MANETIKPGSNGLANIFRQPAINALNTIDETEIEFSVIKPSSWLWLLCCLLLLAGFVSWLIFGKITLTIEAPGIIVATKQIEDAEKTIIRKIKENKETVDELNDLYNKKLELYKKHYLTRIDILRAKEEYLTAQNDLLEIQKALLVPMHQYLTNSPAIALVFVNYQQAKKILLGMSGNFMPSTSVHNHYFGKVIGISEYPISKQLAYHYLKNTFLADTYFNNGPPYLLKFQIDANTLTEGTTIITNIIYQSCSPLHLLLKRINCD